MDYIKSKVVAIGVTVAATLIAAQVMAPMLFDLMLGAAAIGVLEATRRIDRIGR